MKALFARENLEEKIMKNLLVGILAIIFTGLSIQAQSISFNRDGEFLSSGYSVPQSIEQSSPTSAADYRYLFAGRRYYYENPRSGFQRRVDFCSDGYFEMNEVTSYGLDETTGRWTVVEYRGTVYLVMTTSEGRSAFAVYRGSRSNTMVVDDIEYEVSRGSCR
jgi:hypothetical protein